MRILVTFVAAPLCLAGRSHADPPGGSSWRLAFEDNFDGDTLYQTKWNYHLGEYAFGQNPTIAEAGSKVLEVEGVGDGFVTLIYPRWAKAELRGLKYEIEMRENDGWMAISATEIGSTPHARLGMIWSRCRVPLTRERQFFRLRVSG